MAPSAADETWDQAVAALFLRNNLSLPLRDLRRCTTRQLSLMMENSVRTLLLGEISTREPSDK